jgi:hypothetical protein
MKAPYASVILPTLNRFSTLPHALASVQAQTETNLEILIVLDGAIPACREIATSAARADERIRVLDLPKDRGRGELNVDLAVSSARGERIFYTDDDDVWLPNHVATLGPLLEEADIADSRVCSVDRQGGLHLGPCRGSSARVRELLAKARLKMVYDTHIAHRKDAYGRFAKWDSGGETGDPVWEFLAGFARDPDCRWASSEAATALSLHGAARTDVSPSERARESAYWLNRARNLDGDLSRADSAFHLFRVLLCEAPHGGTLEDYLAARGGYKAELLGHRERDLFALFTETPPPAEVATALAIALAEPVESRYVFEGIAFVWFEAYGQPEHERILLSAASLGGANLAACLAAYSVAVSRRDHASALAIARQAVALGPDPVRSLAQWCDRLELATRSVVQ